MVGLEPHGGAVMLGGLAQPPERTERAGKVGVGDGIVGRDGHGHAIARLLLLEAAKRPRGRIGGAGDGVGILADTHKKRRQFVGNRNVVGSHRCCHAEGVDRLLRLPKGDQHPRETGEARSARADVDGGAEIVGGPLMPPESGQGFGKAEMGGGVIGLGGDHRPIAIYGVVGCAPAPLRIAEPDMGIEIVRRECDGLFEAGNGLGVPAERAQCPPQLGVGDRQGRRLGERPPLCLRRFLRSFRCQQCRAEQRLQPGRVGLELDGPAATLHGLRRAAKRQQRGAEIGVEGRAPRRNRDGTADEGDGLFEIADLLGQQAHAVIGLGMTGIDREDALELLLRLAHPPLAEEVGALGEGRGERIGG